MVIFDLFSLHMPNFLSECPLDRVFKSYLLDTPGVNHLWSRFLKPLVKIAGRLSSTIDFSSSRLYFTHKAISTNYEKSVHLARGVTGVWISFRRPFLNLLHQSHLDATITSTYHKSSIYFLSDSATKSDPWTNLRNSSLLAS